MAAGPAAIPVSSKTASAMATTRPWRSLSWSTAISRSRARIPARSRPRPKRRTPPPSRAGPSAPRRHSGRGYEPCVRLRHNLDRRSIRNGIPNLDDRYIADRNAALGPIAIPLRRVERAVVARQTVYEDRAAWLDIHVIGVLSITLLRIRNV